MRKTLLLLALVCCISRRLFRNERRPAQTGWLRVLATETFLGDIAQNVAGSRIKVETLLPVTADPHEFQPTPQDAIKIAQSQVLIVNGLGYETWLTKTLENSGGNGLVVVASNGLSPNPDPSGEHPDGDPHMWMNPLNVVHYVENIRDGLTQADPAGKDHLYRECRGIYCATRRPGWMGQKPGGRSCLLKNDCWSPTMMRLDILQRLTASKSWGRSFPA